MARPGLSVSRLSAVAEHHFTSGDLTLAAHLELPETGGEGVPGVLIIHGFPAGPRGGANSPSTLPELASRIATEMGWVAMVPHLRGMEGSEGYFSLDGWRDDVQAAAVDLLDRPRVDGVWAIGFGTGAALAVCAAARETRIRGVGALAAPADWSEWVAEPRRLLIHARRSGIVPGDDVTGGFEEWAAAFGDLAAERAAPDMAGRALLVVHGTEDDVVSPLEARALAAAHGVADLRLIEGAGHHLRHDPRAIAVLLGWLDRQRGLAG